PIWFLATMLVLVLGILFGTTSQGERVHSEEIRIEEIKAGEEGQELPPIRVRLKGHKNIRIRAVAELQNTWVELAGLLAPVEDEDCAEPIGQPFHIATAHCS